MSKPRATIYAFGMTVLALVAHYTARTAEEIALWQAALGAAIPLGALVLATVRTWPRRNKKDVDTDA